MSDSQKAWAALVWKQERLSSVSTLEGAAAAAAASPAIFIDLFY